MDAATVPAGDPPAGPTTEPATGPPAAPPTDRVGAEPGVVASPEALEAIADLVGRRGPVLFFQSGGCCDGSLPICFEDGEFVIGGHDVLLGRVGGCPYYIDHRQYAVWKHTQLILGVGEGDPEGFSLPAGPGRHFVITSRVLGADPDRG